MLFPGFGFFVSEVTRAFDGSSRCSCEVRVIGDCFRSSQMQCPERPSSKCGVLEAHIFTSGFNRGSKADFFFSKILVEPAGPVPSLAVQLSVLACWLHSCIDPSVQGAAFMACALVQVVRAGDASAAFLLTMLTSEILTLLPKTPIDVSVEARWGSPDVC